MWTVTSKLLHNFTQWNLFKSNFIGISFCVCKTVVQFIQEKLTQVFYIGTWFTVWYIKNFVLSRVQFRQVYKEFRVRFRQGSVYPGLTVIVKTAHWSKNVSTYQFMKYNRLVLLFKIAYLKSVSCASNVFLLILCVSRLKKKELNTWVLFRSASLSFSWTRYLK